MNERSAALRLRVISRGLDLLSDTLVVCLLLAGTAAGILPHEMALATIGYSLRALVHPSLGVGVFVTPQLDSTHGA